MVPCVILPLRMIRTIRLSEMVCIRGRKVITFANILQHDVFPLARILQLVLKYGEQEMRRPVEIEFAATLSREHDKSGTFYLLQIRPIVDSKEMLDEDLNEIPDEDVILRSYNSLGHGIMNDIYDVVYVKPIIIVPLTIRQLLGR